MEAFGEGEVKEGAKGDEKDSENQDIPKGEFESDT